MKTRLQAWREQFEKENANVELPYERTNVVFRSVPNWFVRFFMRVRDAGGPKTTNGLHIFMASVMVLLCVLGTLFYVHPLKARPITELK